MSVKASSNRLEAAFEQQHPIANGQEVTLDQVFKTDKFRLQLEPLMKKVSHITWTNEDWQALLTNSNEIFTKPAVGVMYLNMLRIVFNRHELMVSAKVERPRWAVATDLDGKGNATCGLVFKDPEFCNLGLEASRAKKGFHLWTNPIVKEEGDYQMSTKASYTFLLEQGACKSWVKIVSEC